MKTPWKLRLGLWLDTTPLAPLFLKYDGEAPAGRKRYVNRIDGHLVLRGGDAR